MNVRSASRIAALALGIALVPRIAAAVPMKILMYCTPAGSGTITLNVPTKSDKPFGLKGSFKGVPANEPTTFLHFQCDEALYANTNTGAGSSSTGKLTFTTPLGYAVMATCTNPEAVVTVGGTTCKNGWVFP